ncbi:hypothetical protein MRX96_022051 [Rhipicephalus microplus]
MEKRPHRFSGHPVAGVNWRTTFLVDEVSDVRMCSVCAIIPKKTLKLPCSHVLCECCFACVSQSGSGKCPEDQKTFTVAECTPINFAAKKVNRIKVYCWNEPMGCKFTGPLEDLLQHFENDCAFHVLYCGTGNHYILRNEAVEHKMNGCPYQRSCVETEPSASQTTPVASPDCSVNEEHEKTLAIDVPQDAQLAALQDQMTQLAKDVAYHQILIRELNDGQRKSALTVSNVVTEVVTSAISEAFRKQIKGASFEDDNAAMSALSLSSEKAVILRKLEQYANVTLGTLEELRQNMRQFDHAAVIARCEPVLPSRDRLRHLTQVQTAKFQVGAEIPSVIYNLTVKNADEIFSSAMEDRTLAEVTTWHMRDTYFVVTVRKIAAEDAMLLGLEIEFNDLREGSQWLPSSRSVTVVHPNGRRFDMLEVHDPPCSCKRSLDKLHHAHLSFLADVSRLTKGFCQDKMMTIEIKLAT